ncbi:MAG: bifunctional phosphopantothenoylcysteine decarboxylase/phosphopantothenate--cysteine ligase CoaBC [Mogibacterium sp.]|nr:bifunctional phosphopantothenoylcysteine decarboxylase/phosphopantothenate--cysteine ligase CoaBC [Mogibacterium sp.]
MLEGKTIVLGVTGSIAAYKTAYLASALKKERADVHVIMTRNACQFITPVTFETLTGNKCMVDTFDRNFKFDVAHISLAKAADLILVAPASADFLAKAAHGIADDMLTTVLLAATCPKLVSPAMNTAMYENPITQDNLAKLRHYGFKIIEPASGLLACGDTGKGKMPEPAALLEAVLREAVTPKDFAGLKVLVTAGPTQEAIDPVRYITNHSSGKMGYAIARMAQYRGAEVTLVSGPVSIEAPEGVTLVPVTSAAEMHDAVLERLAETDLLFKAAAVADYTPVTTYDQKVKKKDGDLSIPLKRTLDILGDVAKARRDDQVICGFSMETENLLENSRGKLARKHLDMICANSLRTEGAGFGVDTNVVTVITQEDVTELGKMSKLDTADRILTIANKLYREKLHQI